MELEETANLMVSSDYKERFRAEYYQLKHRTEKLNAMLEKWKNNELGFTPNCPKMILDMQAGYMEMYLGVLEARALIEKIDL